MTSATSARSANSRRQPHRDHPGAGRRGFTLIELLFVTVIIILLASISVPMLLRSQQAARRTRIRAELQTIAMALEAYRTDHGDYPRVDNQGTGAVILAKALIAPGPGGVGSQWTAANSYNAGDYVVDNGKHYRCLKPNSGQLPGISPEFWLLLPDPPDYWDGADGPGFRTRGTQGKVYGPYLSPEKFVLSPAGEILDLFEHPILYFPAAATKPDIHTKTTDSDPQKQMPLFTVYNNSPNWGNEAQAQSLYRVEDNWISPPAPGSWFSRGNDATEARPHYFRRFTAMLGDYDPAWQRESGNPPPATAYNGVIDSGETAASTGPFILWSAGPDGFFGPEYVGAEAAETSVDGQPKNGPSKADLAECDDITNFQ